MVCVFRGSPIDLKTGARASRPTPAFVPAQTLITYRWLNQAFCFCIMRLYIAWHDATLGRNHSVWERTFSSLVSE